MEQSEWKNRDIWEYEVKKVVQAFNLLQHIRGFLASHFSTFCSSHAYENEGRYSSHGVFIPPKSVLLTSNENKKNKYVWTKHASPCIVDEGLSVGHY